MKFSLRMISVLLLVVLAIPLILLTSCGSDDNPSTAPATGSITITPVDGVSWDTGSTVGCNGTVYNENAFVISVLDVNGNPLNDVTIYIDLDLSPNTSSENVMQLIDADLAVPTAVTVPYKTKTGDHGTKNVRVRLDLGGCEYLGTLKVTSGILFNFVELEVTAL